MHASSLVLLGSAAMLGIVHTVLGPDHYVPFIAMARARRWSRRRTLSITLLCGIGHILSSVLVGLVGLFFGIEVLKLARIESWRGDIAGWLLFGFGIAYMLWGLRHALRHRAASLVHAHRSLADAEPDHALHPHVHGAGTHTHPPRANITPWVLFTIFVFGPCEPLIPMLMYPAAQANMWLVLGVALVFGLATITTMGTLVWAGLRGVERISLPIAERYAHALAGFVLALCGASIQFLGL